MESMSVPGARSGSRSDAAGWVAVLARLGYAAKGIVYLAVGGLTAWAVIEGTGGARGTREALAELSRQPFGQTLLIAVAVGLAGYVVWRLVQALVDPEDDADGAKGVALRAGRLASAVVYGGLALWAAKAVMNGGGASAGGRDGARTWSQQLLAQPWGAWVLGAVGVAIAAWGLVELWRAAKRSWEPRLRPDLSGRARRWAGRIAAFGLVARGVVLLMIGGFVVWTAVTADPSRARGMEGALATLGDQPFGPWLMGTVALGLAAYGVFQMVKAWYRRIGAVGGR